MTEIISLISYTLEVDIKGRRPNKVPTFVQYDSSSIDMYVKDDGIAYDLSIFDRVAVFHRVPGGETVVGNAEIVNADTPEDAFIRYIYSGSEMNKAGTVNTSLELYSDDKKVSIQNFQVNIVADNGEGVAVTDEYGLLQELVVQVEEVAKKAIEASEIIDEVVEDSQQAIEDTYDAIKNLETNKSEIEEALSSTKKVRDSTKEVRDETTELLDSIEDAKETAYESADYAKKQGKRAEDAVDAMDKVLEDGTVQTVNGQTGHVVIKAEDLDYDGKFAWRVNGDSLDLVVL